MVAVSPRAARPPGGGGQLGVGPGAVGAGQAGGLADQQGGPPLADLSAGQGGQGVRHLREQGPGQAEVSAAVVGAVAAGERDLRGDPGADLAGRHPGGLLGPPLGGVEVHADPGLRSRGRGLDLLQQPQLVDPVRVVDGHQTRQHSEPATQRRRRHRR
jgi:hypothetical protein